MMDLAWLALGAALAGLTIFTTRPVAPRIRHRLMALYLALAAVIYVGFALAWGDGPWLAVEVGGVGVYAVFAALGLRVVPWLAAGWLLHPLWDVAVHLLGPGAHVVPRWYAVACVSFDVIMAGWLWRMHRAGGFDVDPAP